MLDILSITDHRFVLFICLFLSLSPSLSNSCLRFVRMSEEPEEAGKQAGKQAEAQDDYDPAASEDDDVPSPALNEAAKGVGMYNMKESKVIAKDIYVVTNHCSQQPTISFPYPPYLPTRADDKTLYEGPKLSLRYIIDVRSCFTNVKKISVCPCI